MIYDSYVDMIDLCRIKTSVKINRHETNLMPTSHEARKLEHISSFRDELGVVNNLVLSQCILSKTPPKFKVSFNWKYDKIKRSRTYELFYVVSHRFIFECAFVSKDVSIHLANIKKVQKYVTKIHFQWNQLLVLKFYSLYINLFYLLFHLIDVKVSSIY